MLGNTAVELLEVAPGSLRVLSSPKVDDCVPSLKPLRCQRLTDKRIKLVTYQM